MLCPHCNSPASHNKAAGKWYCQAAYCDWVYPDSEHVLEHLKTQIFDAFTAYPHLKPAIALFIGKLLT
jgi:ribosomal protein L37AE/L43A